MEEPRFLEHLKRRAGERGIATGDLVRDSRQRAIATRIPEEDPNMTGVKVVAHTEGPWHVDGLLGPTVYSAEGRQVAMCRPRETVEDSPVAWDVATGNAQLIAAAPELLQLVREALQSFTDDRDPENDAPHLINVRDWMHAARAAIAKAEGQP
jgi:hypothetical protein